MNARKGLKRAGMRAFAIEGPKGVWIIERERPRRWVIRPAGWPRAMGGKGRNRDVFFQPQPFRRLLDARQDAELRAGL